MKAVKAVKASSNEYAPLFAYYLLNYDLFLFVN